MTLFFLFFCQKVCAQIENNALMKEETAKSAILMCVVRLILSFFQMGVSIRTESAYMLSVCPNMSKVDSPPYV